MKLLLLPLLLLSTSAFADLSASVGASSKYIYRGSVENDSLALQGEIEYSTNGFFVGYWGSTLDYDPSNENGNSGFEHDFYVGYTHEFSNNLSLTSQLMTYVYKHGGTIYSEDASRRTTGLEYSNILSIDNLSLSANVLLMDYFYGNAGDIYLNAEYSYPISETLKASASVGSYIYRDKSDDLLETTESFTLNDVKLSLSKSVKAFTFSTEYLYGGKNRVGDKIDNNFIFSAKYTF
ncbi:TorF family putative porin [Acinetobacter phage AB1I1M-1]